MATENIGTSADLFPHVDYPMGFDRLEVHVHEHDDQRSVSDHHSGEALWLDCPDCGPVAPPAECYSSTEARMKHHPFHLITDRDGTPHMIRKFRLVDFLAAVFVDNEKTGKRERLMAARCSCGMWGRLRRIKMRGDQGRGTERDGRWYCSGACTNGRTSCDCRCQGACHGAGKCSGH